MEETLNIANLLLSNLHDRKIGLSMLKNYAENIKVISSNTDVRIKYGAEISFIFSDKSDTPWLELWCSTVYDNHINVYYRFVNDNMPLAFIVTLNLSNVTDEIKHCTNNIDLIFLILEKGE